MAVKPKCMICLDQAGTMPDFCSGCYKCLRENRTFPEGTLTDRPYSNSSPSVMAREHVCRLHGSGGANGTLATPP